MSKPVEKAIEFLREFKGRFHHLETFGIFKVEEALKITEQEAKKEVIEDIEKHIVFQSSKYEYEFERIKAKHLRRGEG